MCEAIDIREIDPERLYILRQTADFLYCHYNTILKAVIIENFIF